MKFTTRHDTPLAALHSRPRPPARPPACGRSLSSATSAATQPGPVADRGAHHDDAPGHQAGPHRDLGRVPRRELARPRVRVRLPREHHRPAAVRLAAAPEAGHDDRRRIANLHQPVADGVRLRAQRQREVLGRHPGHRRDAVFSLKRAADPNGGGYYARRSTGSRPSRRPATRRSRSCSPSPTTGCSASCRPPGRGRREEVRRGQGQGLRHGDRRHHVLGSVQARLVEDRGRGQDVPNPDYWDTSCPSRRSQLHADRRP